MSKSKRIKDAARELERALKKHVDVVTDSAVSMKKAQRAAARLASAAQVYAEAVTSKTGLDNPFLTGGGKLDAEATLSLRAERDEIAKSLTGSIPVITDELPSEVDLSPTGLSAAELGAFEEASLDSRVPLEDAVEDWEDDSIEIDEDEDEDEPGADDSDDDDAAPSITEAEFVAAVPVEQFVGDEAPATDDLGGHDLFADIVALTADAPEEPVNEEPASEAADSATPVAGSDVWADDGAPTDERPEEAEGDPDPAPELPAEEPASEEDKPYSEDI